MLGASLFAAAALAGNEPEDPFHSSRWPDVRRAFFGTAAVVFDPRVVVTAPASAEDSMNVPVAVRVADDLPVSRIVVFAEMNPIVPVLEFEPLRVKPALSFRMKLQQGSPIRAGALDRNGVWHLGGTWVEASGGGCTAPGTGRASPDWQTRLNRVQARFWRREGGDERLRLAISHPMDTGLAPSIPAFFLENLTLTDETSTVYLKLSLHQPVSQDPVFSFDIPAEARHGHQLRLTGEDNNGNRVDRGLE